MSSSLFFLHLSRPSETVFEFQPYLRVLVVDGEAAAVSMKVIVTPGEFYLIGERIGSGEAVEDATGGNVDVGKGGQLQQVA